MAESKKPWGSCARCQRSTTNRCTGCLEAPIYDDSVSYSTFYCGLACQRADWVQHKEECRKLQARKTLGRAALLLQAIIYQIRLRAFPLQFKSVRIEDSTIYLDGVHAGGTIDQRCLKAFPIHSGIDQGLFEAVLVYQGCTEAMMYLYSFAKELFGGKIFLSSIFWKELDIGLLT